MSDVFGAAYASAYDDLYREKDYEAECDDIVRWIRTFADGAVTRLLDIGCGTGGHAIPLAARGYHVLGVDRSTAMLRRAKAKAEAWDVTERVTFAHAEGGGVNVDPPADAALLLFAVLGYQTAPGAAAGMLRAVRQNVRPGGLLILDVWYEEAVLAQGPGQRWKLVGDDAGETLRFSSGSLEQSARICTVYFHVWRVEKGEVVARADEVHKMRYFSAAELDELLRSAGFELVQIEAFGVRDVAPSAGSWSVTAVARALRD